MPILEARIERWETAHPFVIARGTKNHVDVVVAELHDGDHVAWGEGTPIYYKGDTVEHAVEALEGLRGAVAAGAGRQDLLKLLPAGAARNALDSAMWDLEAKKQGIRPWESLNFKPPTPLLTAYTISLGMPAEMAAAAAIAAERPLLKLKLGGEGDLDRVAAVRAAAPKSRLIADANEAWEQIDIEFYSSELFKLGLELVEQPLPAGKDSALANIKSPIPFAADESLQSRAELDSVMGRYSFINVKLDKCGGLTEALALIAEAKARGLRLMTGCMLSTSLGIAPAYVAAMQSEYADLDGPLLLARDRAHGIQFHGSYVHPPEVALWG